MKYGTVKKMIKLSAASPQKDTNAISLGIGLHDTARSYGIRAGKGGPDDRGLAYTQGVLPAAMGGVAGGAAAGAATGSPFVASTLLSKKRRDKAISEGIQDFITVKSELARSGAKSLSDVLLNRDVSVDINPKISDMLSRRLKGAAGAGVIGAGVAAAGKGLYNAAEYELAKKLSSEKMNKLSAAPSNYVNMYNPNQPGQIIQVDPSQVQKYSQRGWMAPKDGTITGEMLGYSSKQQNEKPSPVDGEGKPMLARIAQGLAGTGAAIGNLRTGMTMASPDTTLYHGTSPNSAAAILGAGPDPSVTGLDTRFAGFADRLNSKMLANAVNTQLMDSGLDPSNDLLERVTDSARKEMSLAREQGIRNFDSVAAVERGARNALLAEGMAPEKIDELLKKARPNLVDAGKRIYLAQTPAVTALYGTNKSELQMINDAVKQTQQNPLAAMGTGLKSMANVLTGGVAPELAQSASKFRYDQAVKGVGSDISGTADAQRLMAALRDQDFDTVEQEIRRLNPSLPQEAIDKIKDRASKGTLGVSFGVRAKRDNLKSLSDFPFISGLLSLNPGLKHEASRYLQTFDPVNDLSVPESIPLQDFRNIDLLDTADSSPLLRLNTPNAKSTAITAAERLRGLRRGLPYLAVGGIGADFAQDAVRQKGLLTGQAFRAGKNKLTSMFSSPQEKQAAIFRESTLQGAREAGRALKYLAAPAAAAAGTGLAASYGYGKASKFIEKKLESPEMLQFREEKKKQLIASGKDPRAAESMANAAARQAILAIASQPIGVAAAATTAAISNPRRALKLLKGDATIREGLGAVGAGYAGAVGTNMMLNRAEQVRMGTDISDQSPMYAPLRGSKLEKSLRENPEYAGLADFVPALALPALGAYAGRKYYSGDYSKILRLANEYPDLNRPFKELTSSLAR